MTIPLLAGRWMTRDGGSEQSCHAEDVAGCEWWESRFLSVADPMVVPGIKNRKKYSPSLLRSRFPPRTRRGNLRAQSQNHHIVFICLISHFATEEKTPLPYPPLPLLFLILYTSITDSSLNLSSFLIESPRRRIKETHESLRSSGMGLG